MSNSREWPCQIHESGHVKFTRVVMSNSWELLFFYKIKIIKIVMSNS